MKIIFLDIDGVLLAGRHLWTSNGLRMLMSGRHIRAALRYEDPRNPYHPVDLADHILPRDTCSILTSVLYLTGARLVVSSSWRLDQKCPDILAQAGLHQLHPDWRTDDHWHGDGQPERGRQIKRWLANHPETQNYVILDDRNDFLPEQMHHFVKTDFRFGLRLEHKRRLLRLLGAPQTPLTIVRYAIETCPQTTV